MKQKNNGFYWKSAKKSLKNVFLDSPYIFSPIILAYLC
jgi:hypothetical protein